MTSIYRKKLSALRKELMALGLFCENGGRGYIIVTDVKGKILFQVRDHDLFDGDGNFFQNDLP